MALAFLQSQGCIVGGVWGTVPTRQGRAKPPLGHPFPFCPAQLTAVPLSLHPGDPTPAPCSPGGHGGLPTLQGLVIILVRGQSSCEMGAPGQGRTEAGQPRRVRGAAFCLGPEPLSPPPPPPALSPYFLKESPRCCLICAGLGSQCR